MDYEWQIKQGEENNIKGLISSKSITWDKSQCLDLPSITTRNMTCELTKEQKEVYKSMSTEMISIINNDLYTAQIVLTQLLRLTQITSGFLKSEECFNRFSPNPKLELLKEIIETIPKDKKIIIWAIFHADSDLIHKELGQSSVVFNGTIKDKDKEKNLYKFNNDPLTRFIICHPNSGGMGLNLSVANYSIYYSVNYSFEQYAQSRERFNRPGQKFKMTEYRLLCKDTIDEKVLDILDRKQKINDFIRGVKESIV